MCSKKKGRSALIAGMDKRMSGECLRCRKSAVQQSVRVRLRSDGAKRGRERWREKRRRIGDGGRSKAKRRAESTLEAAMSDGDGYR